ncbi:S24 family peptidase [Chishuiella sp.]|uniref:LexA family protein n=1 Tax=Chishuiella sp. TaxID=1969467 RepID=UPI0028AAC2DC|nr:S24 family peptidase [Chishuiella sp.]
MNKINLLKSNKVKLRIYNVKIENNRTFIQHYGKVSAGFPSPAEDFIENRISLDERFLTHPESTFIVEVDGESMFPEYLKNDILIIRSDIKPNHLDDIIVSVNKSDYTLKRFDKIKNQLIALNPLYKNCTQINNYDEVNILGVVTLQIREKRKK